MTLQPIVHAPWLVKVHLLGAGSALALGAVQFAAPKGAVPHRVLGWIWSLATSVAVVTSIFLHHEVAGAPGFWRFSPMHLFTLVAAIGLPIGIWAARTRRVLLHRAMMIVVYAGALLTAGLFAVLPGRILHQALSAQVAPRP